jgi:hypothetical protein
MISDIRWFGTIAGNAGLNGASWPILIGITVSGRLRSWGTIRISWPFGAGQVPASIDPVLCYGELLGQFTAAAVEVPTGRQIDPPVATA